MSINVASKKIGQARIRVAAGDLIAGTLRRADGREIDLRDGDDGPTWLAARPAIPPAAESEQARLRWHIRNTAVPRALSLAMNAHRGVNALISIGVCERCGLTRTLWLDHQVGQLAALLATFGDCDHPRLRRAVLAVGWPGMVGDLCEAIDKHTRGS